MLINSGHIMNNRITIDELMAYKSLNMDMLKELHTFANNMNYKIKNPRQNNNAWRKIEQKNIWTTQKKSNQSKEEKVHSKIRGCLNKLSEQNYNSIIKELKSINFKDIATMEMFISIIFRKATTEHKFSEL